MIGFAQAWVPSLAARHGTRPMLKSTVIVGGGVAGLISALIARRRGAHVTVIEQAQRPGGLWYAQNVTLCGDSYLLDYGLRLPVTSGLAEWDDDLFHNPRVNFEWLRFDGYPREGALYQDTFTHESSCFDARLLADERNKAGLLALIAAVSGRPDPDPSAYANDHDFVTAHYGAVYRDAVFGPIMRGLMQRELRDLAPGVSRAFIPRRLIAVDLDERARLVSENPELAGVLAHCTHDALPRGGARGFIYPKPGHISCWMDALQLHLQDLGVEFVFGAGVKQIEQRPGGSATVQLSSGQTLEGDLVVWSLPLVFLAMMRPDLGLKPIVPEFVTLGVHHLKLDRPIRYETQYLLNFNRDPQIFRAVFRDNLVGSTSGIVTVEQMLHLRRDEAPEADDVSAEGCLAELRRAGVVDDETRLLDQQRSIHRNFLPILTPQYAAFNGDVAAAVAEHIPSLVVVGRAGSGALFLDGIFTSALEKLEARFGSSVHDPIRPAAG